MKRSALIREYKLNSVDWLFRTQEFIKIQLGQHYVFGDTIHLFEKSKWLCSDEYDEEMFLERTKEIPINDFDVKSFMPICKNTII